MVKRIGSKEGRIVNQILHTIVNPKNTSKRCHRCGHVARKVEGREFRCPKCGLVYNRDLNSAIDLVRSLTRGAGWGRREGGWNGGSPVRKGGVVHRLMLGGRVGAMRLISNNRRLYAMRIIEVRRHIPQPS